MALDSSWGRGFAPVRPIKRPYFVKSVLENGGDITPLYVDSGETRGTGLTNGSIAVVDDKILVNLRHVEYTLYHAEKVKYAHPWGPVVYLHPENDWRLKTNNFVGTVNENFDGFSSYSKVDTSRWDVDPLWDFVGLEDARLVHWDGSLYLTGVRRDTTKNGVGRMELSRILPDQNGKWKEVSRERIPIPGEHIEAIDTGPSYCEKNWMPIVDKPFHYVKWCNPVQVVKYCPEKKETTNVHLDESSYNRLDFDFRGGSHVIPYKKDYYICLTHITNLFKSETGRKNCVYRHRFVIFDKNWNVVKYTDELNFMGCHVEFSCGMAFHKGNYLIPFGTQDNSSYLLKIPEDYFDKYIGDLK